MSGYTSFQGYTALLKHFDQVRPDVVIASFSFNDWRVVPSEAATDSHDKFEREALLHRLDFREKIYLYRGLQRLLTKLRLIKSSGDGSMTVDARTAPTRVSPDQYRTNLERIARFCQERQVPLVFIALQDNPAHSEHLRTGITHLNNRRYEQAETELRVAMNLDNWFSDLARKYLAVVLEHRGATAEATLTASLTLPSWKLTHGGRPLRLDSEYNDIMRAVAREYGAVVVEAGQILAKDASLISTSAIRMKGHRHRGNNGERYSRWPAAPSSGCGSFLIHPEEDSRPCLSSSNPPDLRAPPPCPDRVARCSGWLWALLVISPS